MCGSGTAHERPTDRKREARPSVGTRAPASRCEGRVFPMRGKRRCGGWTVARRSEIPSQCRGEATAGKLDVIDRYKSGVTMMRAAFPDLHLDLQDIIAEGDRVAIRYTLHGTHEGVSWECLRPGPARRATAWCSHVCTMARSSSGGRPGHVVPPPADRRTFGARVGVAIDNDRVSGSRERRGATTTDVPATSAGSLARLPIALRNSGIGRRS